MPSPRAQGSYVSSLMAFESSYGVAPDGSSGGVYVKLPFGEDDIGGDQNLGYDGLLGLGRDGQAPYYEGFNVGGGKTVPLDLRFIGYWLRSLFGAPVTSDVGDGVKFSHVFTAGGDVPSFTLETGYTNLTTPEFEQKLGCRSGTFSFDMARSGPANASIDVIGQNDIPQSSSLDATPITHELRRFNQGNGSILVNAAPGPIITAGRAEFTNSLETVEALRTDGLVEAVDPTDAMMTGSVTVRHSVDMVLPNAGRNQTPASMFYQYVMPGVDAYTLRFDMPAVYFPVRKKAIRGAGGIEATYDWRAAHDVTAGHMLQATLINDVASY